MGRWPMKKERKRIQLARANLSVEQIAARMKLAPASVLKAANRLGFDLLRIAPKGGTLKAKGK
jgi:Mn-dependent DtxR family transcriptional regulator